ncbi:hypothetical protein VDBG_04235 [Verticillium alfalfae VaMs.102]|uniref:Uncharacterized protein n=1 Tax=Verticillium alfalfae (strain VaMs.102 / ATCC MYA-4576 / FGSC 10136) TaxID=526221 RepID=C9SGH6_VERA1|nr:hypothetical protein VDBG_04235 [Verticillium alfalfae VaMs.102]EEY18126.1 hypothetical protein VDBG_04235 [Verticillium alfalfae VaMs.102]
MFSCQTACLCGAGQLCWPRLGSDSRPNLRLRTDQMVSPSSRSRCQLLTMLPTEDPNTKNPPTSAIVWSSSPSFAADCGISPVYMAKWIMTDTLSQQQKT